MTEINILMVKKRRRNQAKTIFHFGISYHNNYHQFKQLFSDVCMYVLLEMI